MNDKTKKLRIFAIKYCPVLASVLLVGLGFSADASGLSLHGQIQSGVENKHLECNRQDHLLVVRPSLQFACVTGESASRLGWKEVSFSDDNDMMVSYTPLEVEIDGEKFQINATLKNGLIQKAGNWGYYDLSLKIIPTRDGEAKLEILRSFFTSFDPELSIHEKIMVITPSEEIPSNVKFEQGRYVVEFSFSEDDSVFEFGLASVPKYCFPYHERKLSPCLT
ncbi:MAG: hypothetical protein EB830_04890 [Nitrosopumilus sp. H13]|nr:MAG: hypothetical protein EB830_04890 [Nitrosopumilus sp. H13]